MCLGLLGGYFGRVQLPFIGLFLFLVFPARLLLGHAFVSRALYVQPSLREIRFPFHPLRVPKRKLQSRFRIAYTVCG